MLQSSEFQPLAHLNGLLKKNLMTVSTVNLFRLPRGAEFAFLLFFRGSYAMAFNSTLM